MHNQQYVFDGGSIIERIGYTRYLFGHKVEFQESPGPYFKCYEDNDINYKANNKFNCDGLEGISEIDKKNELQLYPNPTTDKINISISIGQNLIMQVYNTVGQCVMQKELNNFTNSIDISSLINGIYILKITSPNGTIEKKIIKE